VSSTGTLGEERSIAEEEQREILRANQSASTPVVFVHGLWLLPSSWDRWADLFRRAGYATLTPGWPYDLESLEEAKAKHEVFTGKSIEQVAEHFEQIIGRLIKRPVIIGHSFGGLLTQILAGRGLAAASVVISPARPRRVLPLFVSGAITIDPTIPSKLVALRPAPPELRNTATRHRAVPLKYDEFRRAFANAVDEDQAKRLYEQFCVPASSEEIFADDFFQPTEATNLDPRPAPEVHCTNPDRGPMLIIAGGKDHTVPIAISRTEIKHEQANEGATKYIELPDRDHALVIDDNWQEVAETALKFVRRFVS
jgi:pimeloyl-ACP methyl ester carboxylesterase